LNRNGNANLVALRIPFNLIFRGFCFGLQKPTVKIVFLQPQHIGIQGRAIKRFAPFPRGEEGSLLARYSAV
jgi:hypothetical protein